jgi:hypothetical protein
MTDAAGATDPSVCFTTGEEGSHFYLKEQAPRTLVRTGVGGASFFRSGEGGIRTLGDVAATPAFETGTKSPQLVADSRASADDPGVLPCCLALLTRKCPDLATVVRRWDALPEAARCGIVAIVRAAVE